METRFTFERETLEFRSVRCEKVNSKKLPKKISLVADKYEPIKILTDTDNKIVRSQRTPKTT